MLLMTSGPTWTTPSLGWSRPAMRLSKVVLPEPDGPMRARNSPSGTSRFRSLSTSICSLPRRKYLCTPQTTTIGSPGIAHPRPAGATASLLQERHEHAHVGPQVAARLLAVGQ